MRLIHLLAHHPDFEGEEHDEEEIATMSKYLEMYLETLATQDNVSFLWHLAGKIKSVRDKHSPEYDTVSTQEILTCASTELIRTSI